MKPAAPFAAALMLLGTLTAALAEPELTDANSWAFTPGEDRFTDAALLDLRHLNEKQSGASGFVRLSADGNSFVRGDGEPVRFWAIGSDLYRAEPEQMDRHCRFLAKMGVNMVRLHTTVAAHKEGAALTDVNEREIAGIFRFIKAAKDNGIYLTISPYYGHHDTPKSWQLEGYSETGAKPWGALFVDPRMQAAYKAWTRELYTRENPHTGLAIAEDPTVAILQVHNEDTMLFWTMQRLPDPQQARLEAAWADWLTERYGDLAAAVKAWDGESEQGDDLAAGRVKLLSTWHMTQDWKGGAAKRMNDQVRFIAEHQRAFYAEMGRYLREELGCKQLLNATNWRTANDAKLKDIERWTYAALDIDAENEYYGSDYQHKGETDGYQVAPGHLYVNESCLHKPLELTTNFKQQAGHPFIVTETSWKNPNLYQTEGPFLVAAFQSIGGVDAVYWFSAQEEAWCVDPGKPFWRTPNGMIWHKWSCMHPTLVGMFPANALLYRRGDLKPAATVVHEQRTLDALFAREAAAVDDNEIYGVSRETDELRSARRPDGRVSRAAFLVGRVETVLGGDPKKSKIADLNPYLKPGDDLLVTTTGQVKWNYKAGWCTVDSPRAQGVTGFLKDAGGVFKLSDVVIQSDNDYAAISVVSLDAKPLRESRSILVQVGTYARTTGFDSEPRTFKFGKGESAVDIAGREITHMGKAPWRVANTRVKLTLINAHVDEAVVLDAGGYAVKRLGLESDKPNVQQVMLPGDAMYVVLRAAPPGE